MIYLHQDQYWLTHPKTVAVGGFLKAPQQVLQHTINTRAKHLLIISEAWDTRLMNCLAERP
jgi:hypothetical protein